MDGNVKDTPPVVTVPKPDDAARWEALPAEIKSLRERLVERKRTARPDFESWLTSAQSETIASGPGEGIVFRAPLDDGVGGEVEVYTNGQHKQTVPATDVAWEEGYVGPWAPKISADETIEVSDAGDREKDEPYTVSAWVKLAKANQSGSVVARMDDGHEHRGWDLWIENGRLGAHIIHQWDQDALKAVSNAALSVGKWNHVLATYDGSGKAAGLKFYVNGARQPATVMTDRLKQTIQTEVALKIGRRESSAVLEGASIQDVRLYRRALSESEIAQVANGTRAAWLVKIPADHRTDPQTQELFDWWLATLDKPTQQTTAKIATLEKEQAAIKARGTVAHIMQERPTMPVAYVLNRGEYDQRRDKVTAETPKLLPPLPAEAPHNRLGLAKWLVAPENPLTSRVAVNQFWQGLFGSGIVRTTGDFGTSGELPSHPELLDWLAVDFRESGWDVKRLFRMLVTSAAYRQSAAVTPEKLAADPQDRLLSRGPRFRMDAEMIRDYALAASGLLARKIGGPSVKPYQPPGVWEAVAMRESNTREYAQDHGENLYRRSLYTFWKRARAAGRHGNSQRPHARNVRSAPRPHRYAAAGAGDVERSAIRRSGSAAC